MPPSLKRLVNPKNILGILPAPKNGTSGIATSPELPGVRHNCDASDDTISLPYCKTSQKTKVKEFNVKKEDILLFQCLL